MAFSMWCSSGINYVAKGLKAHQMSAILSWPLNFRTSLLLSLNIFNMYVVLGFLVFRPFCSQVRNELNRPVHQMDWSGAWCWWAVYALQMYDGRAIFQFKTSHSTRFSGTASRHCEGSANDAAERHLHFRGSVFGELAASQRRLTLTNQFTFGSMV